MISLLIDSLESSSDQKQSENDNENDSITDEVRQWFKDNIDSKLQYKQLEKCSVDETQSPSNNKSDRQIPSKCYTKVDPTQIPGEVVLIAHSEHCLSECLNLDIADHDHFDEIMDILVRITSGDMDIIHQYLPNCLCFAHRYAGHQFGHFAGQLGDGRAISLGTLNDMECQTKGSGRTPFSRFGDGRAVLFSSIREFLASEAMYHLGIATTRGAVLVGSHEYEVLREQKVEPTAILLRVSRGFIRFGSFETSLIDHEMSHLVELLDYVIDTHYHHLAEIEDDEEKYEQFWSEVVDRTVRMAVQWKSVGFVHGVLNTDNMSILGETIDYGPYGFVEYFDENFIPNHSDTNGRYSWFEQEQKIKWNLQKLAEALAQIGVLPMEKAMKYLKVGNQENEEQKENVDAQKKEKVEFPFAATNSMDKFNSFLAENALRIKAKKDFVRNLRDHRGLSLLHCAVISGGDPKVIDVLITEHGLDINAVDIDGYSPLFYAMNQDQYDCAERLLAYYPQIELVTKDAVQVTNSHVLTCKLVQSEKTLHFLKYYASESEWISDLSLWRKDYPPSSCRMQCGAMLPAHSRSFET